MRTILVVILLAAIAAGMLLTRLLVPYAPTPQSVVIQSLGPTIERLERLSQLTTTRVSIADVLTGEGSGCKGAWLIKGDALIAVDLSKAAIVEKDETARRATIRMPQLGPVRENSTRSVGLKSPAIVKPLSIHLQNNLIPSHTRSQRAQISGSAGNCR